MLLSKVTKSPLGCQASEMTLPWEMEREYEGREGSEPAGNPDTDHSFIKRAVREWRERGGQERMRSRK